MSFDKDAKAIGGDFEKVFGDLNKALGVKEKPEKKESVVLYLPLFSLCRVGWHRWGMWEEFDRGPIIQRRPFSDGFAETGIYVEQKRTCQSCNRVTLKTIKTHV